MEGNALYTCTPGYPSTGITPASTFGPFLTQTYVPGTCNNYDFTRYEYKCLYYYLHTYAVLLSYK
jgi:hypothetical protein